MGRFKDEGNILVSNQSNNVLVNYNFMLRVEGIYDLPCKSVHSFTKENEFEYVQEGGLNDYVHMLRKPVSKPFSFTVERYVGMDIIPPLQLGAELILPVILMVAPNADQFEQAKRTFVFTGCTVMSKTYGELNAEKSDLLTETIVIGYREMTEVTIPMHGRMQSPLKGPDTGEAVVRKWPEVSSAKKKPKVEEEETVEGEEETPPRVKQGPNTGEAKVRKWLVKKGQEGESVQSAKDYADFGKKEPGAATTRKWPKESSAKDYTDFGKKEPGVATTRKWPKESSAKDYSDFGKKEPGAVKVRTWPPTQSARKSFGVENKKEE